MQSTLLIHFPVWLIAVIVFVFMMIFIRIGIGYRRYEIRKGKEKAFGGLGSLENSMLTLLGLLLAFTFGMAINKFENRRKTIVEESNAIGTAILRCDLYPDSTRLKLRKLFEPYVEWRINYYNAGNDEEKVHEALAHASTYSQLIWNEAAAQPTNMENLVRNSQMIPALNSMIDVVSVRDADRIANIPPLIMLVLILMTFTGSFLVGYDQSSARRSKVFLIGFAFMTAISIYLILELDKPRSGLINLHDTELYMENLRQMLK